MEENVLQISDAAREVHVEAHVLRYWEEELRLPIKRNELGHRYYTREDVERFRMIKGMKDKGLQLKAIRTILRNGSRKQAENALQPENGETAADTAAPCVCPEQAAVPDEPAETREEKAQRLQWILTQLVRQAMQENNEELARSIRDSVVKELDYQFRLQEEREEKRARLQNERSEEYYRKLDELLRSKGNRVFSKGTFPKPFSFGKNKKNCS